MEEARINDLLRQLRSAAPQEAWVGFLERYSPLLLEVVHLFERDEDAAGECYLFVCEQLCRNNFRRLLRFRPGGPARFTTWLCAVTRNLCLDWHRHEVGRHRVFASVGRLSALDQQIFHCLFVELLPVDEALLRLRPAFPHLTIEQACDSSDRVQDALTSRQRWLLNVRRARAAVPATASVGQDAAAWDAPSEMPSPETWAELQEKRAGLREALSTLSAQERMLVRLRFEHELTLDEIARLLHLGSAQGADRRIQDAVEKLRAVMRGKQPARSV